MPRTKQSARTKQIAREKTSRRRNFNRKNGKFVGISIPFVRRAKPVKITDLTVDLTIDDDEISELTNDDDKSIDLTNDDDEVIDLTWPMNLVERNKRNECSVLLFPLLFFRFPF